ncbi:MAG: hypothetical protein Q4B70_18020, partial [Lachnospiraceae bacterium]|nr:hypothetical protein [Lachnospiraceae bacterium]
TRIKKLLGKTVEPAKTKSKAIDIVKVKPDGEDGGGSGPGHRDGPEPGPHPGPGPEPGTNPGSNSGGNEPGDTTKYKEIKVKKRLVCKDAADGKYLLNFIAPSTASKGKLEFSLSGEQSDFDLPLLNAKIISSGTTNIERIMGNKIYINDLKKGEQMKIEVSVDFDSYCMMEVDYYANKK